VGVEGAKLSGVELGVELELELLAGTTTPPCTLPAELDEVFMAFAM
jgi:hypothetical protein